MEECHSCGYNVDSGSNHCIKCGASVNDGMNPSGESDVDDLLSSFNDRVESRLYTRASKYDRPLDEQRVDQVIREICEYTKGACTGIIKTEYGGSNGERDDFAGVQELVEDAVGQVVESQHDDLKEYLQRESYLKP